MRPITSMMEDVVICLAVRVLDRMLVIAYPVLTLLKLMIMVFVHIVITAAQLVQDLAPMNV
jgi:hypothetical protein